MERLTDKELVKKLQEHYYGDHSRADEAYLRLAELEDKFESGALVELSDDILTKLLRCVVFKCKYGRGNNYFEPFKGADAFGQPQVMSMDELLLRTTIDLLGIENQEQAEERLKVLKSKQ